MPSNHPILCCPLLLLPSIFPSIKVFSTELALHIRWNFSISPSSKYSEWFPLGLTGLVALLSKGLSRVFSSTTVWKHQFFGSYLEHLLRLLESVPPKSLKPQMKSTFLFAASWNFFFRLTMVPLVNILNNCCTDFQNECISHLPKQHRWALTAPPPHQHLLFPS